MHRFVFGLGVALMLCGTLAAQQANEQVPASGVAAASSLPEAPVPQGMDVAEATYSSSLVAVLEAQTPSTTQIPTPPPDETPEQRKARAEAELKAEETQRIGGIVPNFMAVNSGKALPITPGQKFQLFFKGAFDSYQFILAGIDAGISMAEDEDYGYGGGMQGFARRFGANYGDNFDGNFWGNAVLPSLLHQDPRYFRMGHGKVLHRALYSISTTFRTRGDSGNWQPAYSNLLGNLIGASISNAYYPNYKDNEVGLYPTLRRGLSITYQGTIGGLLEEFYPDLSDKYKQHRQRKAAQKADPATAGLDMY